MYAEFFHDCTTRLKVKQLTPPSKITILQTCKFHLTLNQLIEQIEKQDLNLSKTIVIIVAQLVVANNRTVNF